MTNEALGQFTADVVKMVSHNDRTAWMRSLRRALSERAKLVGFAWSAIVLAAFVLYLLPMNMQRA